MQKEFNTLDIKGKQKLISDYLKNTFERKNISTNNYVTIYSKDIGKMVHTTFNDKLRSLPEIKELLEISQNVGYKETPNHPKFKGFFYCLSKVKAGAKLYDCTLNIGVSKDTNVFRLYDINKFKEMKKEEPVGRSVAYAGPSNSNLIQKEKVVKKTDKKFKLDSQGNELTEEQRIL